jgi:dihydrofolate reductase
MRAIVLFIATSLDGYIAGPNDEIDWLFTDGDYGYTDFFASIDTVLQGRKTYAQTLTFADDPYPGKRNIVFSRAASAQPVAGVELVGGDIVGFTRALQQQPGADIWLGVGENCGRVPQGRAD